jgi:hypothetical protein
VSNHAFRLRVTDLLAALLLIILAGLVSRKRVTCPFPSGPAAPGGGVTVGKHSGYLTSPRWRLTFSLSLALALLVVYWLTVRVAASWDDGLSVAIGAALGSLTIWTSWGLFLKSTGAKAKQEWLPAAFRWSVLLMSIAAAVLFYLASEPIGRGDIASLIIFALCQLVAIILDWFSDRWA